MSKKEWGKIVIGTLVHAQLIFRDNGVKSIDEVSNILETAFSIITTYKLHERDYFEGVLRRINSELCLAGYPSEVITKFQ